MKIIGAIIWLAFAAGSSLAGEPNRALSGGDTTVFVTSKKAFSRPLRNIRTASLRFHAVGNSFFNKNWVAAPASTASRDGLGPLFSTRSCSACHTQDGRGRAPDAGEQPLSLILRLSIPGEGAHGAPLPDPTYGSQLSTRAVPKAKSEGRVDVAYDVIEGSYADGSTYTLRKPHFQITQTSYGSLDPKVMTSPRVAPAVHGLGLIEAVPTEMLLEFSDPTDADDDGISGRPNLVWEKETQKTEVGRYGWKANQPSLKQQAAAAFLGDMGITSSLFPEPNHTGRQASLDALPNGGAPEISDKILDRVATYLLTLAPPARRNIDDPQVIRGETLFSELKCASCHRATLRTGAYPDLVELENQTIHPYTDVLLHDMGEGLADGRPDFEATGREWRTPPLWGIGLQETVNGHTDLLHDGRARGFEEAILWHGGEAEASRNQFKGLPKSDRDALVAFLKSL